MGIYSRDYYRELTPSPWSFDGALVIKYIIIANVVVFLLQIFIVQPPRISEAEFHTRIKESKDKPLSQEEVQELMQDQMPVPVLQQWLELDTNKIIQNGQVWRLLTHAFCHNRLGIFHILFNMIFLYWFGRTIELMYGSREFLLFYLTAAVFAGLAYVGLDLYTGSRVPAVGASGAVMAVLMLYTMHFPRETICVCWFIPMEMRWLMALYIIWDLHPVLLSLAGDKFYTGVGHAAHLGGLLFGFLYYWYDWHLERVVERLRFLGWRVKARVRVSPGRPTCRISEADPDASRVDEVLEKISRYGQESLSEEERTILRAASEKLKTRARDG